jgi:NADH:ubiquinone reductase (H+-translocating)
LRVVLLQSGPRILPELPESLSQYAHRLLTRRHVDIRLHTRLSAVTADEAYLDDGTILPTKTVIATIGATPNPVLVQLPCQKERGRIVVNEYLEVPEYPGVWALGDCAHIIDHKTGEPCPPTAQYAVREGKRLALNIVAALDGGERHPFSFSALGMMGSLGHLSAVGNVLGIRVSGWLAWALWRAIYWAKLPGLTRKFRVAVDWSLSFVLPRDVAQLNVSPSESITREHFEAHEVIFHQGDLGDRMYVIIDGEVEVVEQRPGGSEVVLATLQAGQWFGEMALFNDEPRGATLRTVTNVNALALDRSAFKALVSHIPPVHDAFERIMQERDAENRAKHQRLEG